MTFWCEWCTIILYIEKNIEVSKSTLSNIVYYNGLYRDTTNTIQSNTNELVTKIEKIESSDVILTASEMPSYPTITRLSKGRSPTLNFCICGHNISRSRNSVIRTVRICLFSAHLCLSVFWVKMVSCNKQKEIS